MRLCPPRRFWPFLALFLFLLLLNLPAFAQQADKNVAIRLLPEKTTGTGGETITVGIEQTIRKGWHTYWLNPGDSGAAARIVWKAGDKTLDAAPIQWPVPKKLPMGPLLNYGYEDTAVLLQDITLPKNLGEEAQDIAATIDILVCKEICIPETHIARFTVNGDEEPVPAAVERARAALPIDMGWQASSFEKEGFYIELYPEEWGLIANPEKTNATIEDGKLVLSHKRGERALSDVPVSNIVVAYEDASGARKGVRVSVLAEGVQAAVEEEKEGSLGIVQAIFFAFLGGIILNLMPCVFPVLSMKALSLVKLQDKEQAKARRQGLAYTAGILACFALIAGILMALKAGGAQIGWGFQLQHPGVILFLSYLFFLLGLNLIGFFEIDLRLAGFGQRLTQRTGITGSFFTGALATLVATPCTAPFMGAAMGYALTQPAYVSMAVFMALGLGLAAPYLALCYSPALRHKLPKPGAWMEHFRQFLAFPMFASAGWLLWVLAIQIDHMSLFIAILGLLALAFIAWLLQRRPAAGRGRLFVHLLAILIASFVLYSFYALKPATVTQSIQAEDFGEDFTRAKLDDYLKGDDPVFVNMTAAWCITCKVNEKVALTVDATKALFKERGVRYLKGDWTNQNPEITNFLESYGRSGVPLYVYYGPRIAETGARPEPVVLPQILTPGLVEETLTP
jgi:thiol:disulfide interchange protein/DsbC/DsbD-like thiol-disulfide interchange protein